MRHRAVIALLLVAAAVPPAAAQFRGLVRPVRIQSVSGEVELGYWYESVDRQAPSTGFSTDQTETSGIVGLGTDIEGSFLHPSLLPFRLGGTLRLRRTNIDTSTGRVEGRQDADDSEYSFRLGILPRKKWSGEVAAERTSQDLNSAFAPRRLIARRQEEASLFYRSRSWPLRLQWLNSRAKGLAGDPRDETRREGRLLLTHQGPQLNLSTRLETLDYLEDYTKQDYVTDRFSGSLVWRPGASRKFWLSTSLFGYDRSGTNESKHALVGQAFDYQPNRDFLIHSRAEYENLQEEIGERTTRRGQLDLTHTLWGSLTSHASGRLERQLLPLDGSFDTDELVLGLDYARNLRAGTLGLGWGRTWRTDREDLPRGERLLTEDLVYQPGLPLLLQSPQIIPGTVTLTDPSGSIVYVEGIDFDLVSQGNLIEIRVIPGGAILDGDPLRATYLESTAGELDLRGIQHNVSGSWRGRWGEWTRLRYLHRSNDVLAGSPDTRIDNVLETEYIVGVTRPRWSVRASLRDRRSSILSFKTEDFGASYRLFSSRSLDFSLRGQAQRTSYPQRVDDTRSTLFGAQLRYTRRRFRVDLFAEHRNETIFDRDGKYLLARMIAAWKIREIEVLLHWRVRNQDVEVAGLDNRQEIRLTLRRRIR